jgi:uncharacterized protein YcfJ
MMMKTLNTFRAATLATFALAAVSLPTLAQATDNYRVYDSAADCRADENDARLVGGIVGAVLGGVVGSQVSGNGARTEGSAIGAVVGGLAGAGIGDESVDCNKRRQEARYNGQTYGTSTRTVYRDTGYRDSGHTTVRHDDYGYRNHGQRMKERRRLEKKLRKISKRKAKVRYELRELNHERYNLRRWEYRQAKAELRYKLQELNHQERVVQRRLGYRTAGYNRDVNRRH